MIAVIAAMLFIGIVTASMLKNTGSLSRSSVAYGNMAVMNSTTRSGMIATESFFGKSDNTQNPAVLKLITDYLNSGASEDLRTPQLVSFGNTNTRQQLGNDKQYFSSKLRVNEDATRFSFEVTSGRTQNGKALKKAIAFYSSDNDVKVTNTGTSGAKNAFYSKGSVMHANAGIEVIGGPATFESEVQFQGGPSIFHHNVYFGDKATFLSGPTGVPTAFNDRAYFANDVILYSGGTFASRVGIEGNLETNSGSKVITVDGNMWINGDLGMRELGIEPHSGEMQLGLNNANSINLNGAGNNVINYTNNLSIITVACSNEFSAYEAQNEHNGLCTAHNKRKSEHLSSASADNITDFSSLTKSTNGAQIANINTDTSKLGMGTLVSRRDPEFNLAGKPDGDGGIYSVTPYTPSSSKITLDEIERLYAQAQGANQLYDGHVVIKLSGDVAPENHMKYSFDGYSSDKTSVQ